MNPGRAPFDVTIALPGGRAYHAAGGDGRHAQLRPAPATRTG